MRTFALPAALLISSAGATAQAVESLDEAAFVALHAATIPDDPEPWEAIPWRTDLTIAQREAAASGRPLFLWTMNGHPLGCT